MKRAYGFLILVICVATGLLGVNHARSVAHARAAEAERLAGRGHLTLDAATRSILAKADRVETFRLADFHEGEDRTPEENAILSDPHVKMLDNYTVLRVGKPQGRAFAAQIGQALSQVNDPNRSGIASCFDPGVGFRVWRGQAHVDICVCFYCSGVEITTHDAGRKAAQPVSAGLGQSRAALLALSRAAFPEDKKLAALKDDPKG